MLAQQSRGASSSGASTSARSRCYGVAIEEKPSGDVGGRGGFVWAAGAVRRCPIEVERSLGRLQGKKLSLASVLGRGWEEPGGLKRGSWGSAAAAAGGGGRRWGTTTATNDVDDGCSRYEMNAPAARAETILGREKGRPRDGGGKEAIWINAQS
ncbi:hypothetical protein CKAH01_04395 [Colletotrichum kahawae]|uniref:Uncharacterized protein n=1 Tax=Colletotrichum kahawae TaxID=34407 RepID=A0AAD9YN60_COLKA|nr:hypothetical protein CKAH01_04395 [Colletotrichum kahawae]